MFESAKEARISKFELKLRPVDNKYISIPDIPHSATVCMPSSTFQQICRCASV